MRPLVSRTRTAVAWLVPLLPAASRCAQLSSSPWRSNETVWLELRRQGRSYSTHTGRPPSPLLDEGKREPLCILFCGSDDFSCASLRALQAERAADPQLIESIDVLVRPSKRTGRGLKRLAAGPVTKLAAEYGLRVHERDTFTGWELPNAITSYKTGTEHGGNDTGNSKMINMVIAVSFGLFVPPRILDAAKYGGLNVHPSLLPELRGACPLQWTIMHGLEKTGVTVQTLHAKFFDRGAILAQTDPPVAVKEACTLHELGAELADEGARLLVQTIREGRYLGIDGDTMGMVASHQETALLKAPKLCKQDSEMDWSRCVSRTAAQESVQPWAAKDVVRRYRALGPLWSHVVDLSVVDGRSSASRRRVILRGISTTTCPSVLRGQAVMHVQPRDTVDRNDPSKGSNLRHMICETNESVKVQSRFSIPIVVADDGTSIIIPMPSAQRSNASGLLIREILIEGEAARPAAQGLERFLS